ncbi:MAG: chemotaxis protein CheW [bacterium]
MDKSLVKQLNSSPFPARENVLSSFSIPSHDNADLYLTFNLTEKNYAIEAAKIIEIVQLPELSILEKAPEYIVGVMNLRGKIISIIDMRRLLGIPQACYTIDHQVLIINCKDKTIGVIIDSVKDVITFRKSEIQPLPYNSHEHFISGIYKSTEHLIALLNLDLLVEEISSVETIKHNAVKPTAATNYLFPTDAYSQDKLKKRALKLQRELKADTTDNSLDENRFVSFVLNQEQYCISLKHVKEFCKLKLVTLTTVPCVPEFISGIINLRGEFITIIDIKSFLQIPKSRTTDKTKIIVVQAKGLQIGLVVDDVFNIINIPFEKLSHHPPAKFEQNKYTLAEVMHKDFGVMSVFNIEKFLEDERLYVEDAI